MLAPCVAQKFVNTPQDLFGYGRSPGWGEFLKESLASAFERTTTGAVLDEADVLAAEKEAYGANAPGYKEQALTDPFGGFAFGPMAAPDSGTAPAFIPREEWNENNPLFREGIEWREGMTEVRARVYAEDYDLREFRNRLIARGEEEYGFLGGTVPGFFAGMLGSLPDPVNLIPLGRALGAGKGFLAGAKRGAFEGALSNAAVDALVFPDLQRRGADLGVADFALDAAFGAALGGILGGAGGYLGARRAARAEERAKALDALAASEEAADRVKREQGKVTGYYLDPFEWARQETREALLTARRSIHGRDRQPILKAFELAADAVTDGRAVDVGPVPGLREAIGRAYDAVLDDPLGGPADEVLAVLRSPEFERVLLERGPAFFAEDGHLIFSGEYIQRVSGFPRSGGGW